MKNINRTLSILLLIALSFSCTNFFDESKYGPAEASGKSGEYKETDTYHSDFTSTRFYYVKDVYRTEGNGYVEVRSPSNPFVSSAETRTQTTDSDWTEGSYVILRKNSETATFKSKTVTTYTSILYTKQSDGTYKTLVLGTDVKIDGIGEYGFFTLAGGEYYGTFFYTKKGWNASSNGTQSLTVNYDLETPTYEEVINYIKNGKSDSETEKEEVITTYKLIYDPAYPNLEFYLKDDHTFTSNEGIEGKWMWTKGKENKELVLNYEKTPWNGYPQEHYFEVQLDGKTVREVN